jgi:hypothetical protein
MNILEHTKENPEESFFSLSTMITKKLPNNSIDNSIDPN